MIDLVMCEAIRDTLTAQLGGGVYVGLPHDNERITFPCVLLDLRGSSLLKSPLWTGQLTAAVGHQADDSTVEEHAALVEQVGAILNNLTINSDAVQLYGIVSKNSDSVNQDRHWNTNLSYTLGYGPKP